MRIAYIAAGAGGMYCGSCIRDNALARELQGLGHEVLLLPIYTPLKTDEASVADRRVFYGAIQIYLHQKAPWLARLPRWMTSWLDHPALLRMVSTSGATDARLLGELTLSMLRGEAGHQASDLEQLVAWLRDEYKPDLIQLTNSMLLGLARRLREELPEATVVCALQGEDIFLEDLIEPYHGQVLEELRRRARDVDLFVATSEFYRQHMSQVLDVPVDRIVATRIGITLDGLEPGERPPESPWMIGYLARICPEKGLHHLVDAFEILSEKLGPGAVRLRVAGYLGGRDKAYMDRIVKQISRAGLRQHVDLVGEVDRAGKLDFLRSLHVLSVPTDYREPKGIPVLEAQAMGIPVVQPAHGAFPEILERTGGGTLVRPGDSHALADALERLLRDPSRRQSLGRTGREGVERHFTARAMAEDTLAAYERARALAETA